MEAKEDLIATLEESLEEAKFQVKTLCDQLNKDGEKYQSEVQTLTRQRDSMEKRATELETRVQEAHERYVASKGKSHAAQKQHSKRSTSNRFVRQESSQDYASVGANPPSQPGKKRNLSSASAARSSQHDEYVGGNRSRNSSYHFLHLTKDLEKIYKEFEAGEVNELNKLRRLVSHFRGLSRRTQVQLHDLKTSTAKQIALLKDQYQTERKKRIKVQEEKLERQAQLMQDIADKDSIIFALNKQLSSLKGLLQSQELLMTNSVSPADNVSLLNQSALINSSLQQIQQLALKQQRHAIKNNRQSLVGLGLAQDANSICSYYPGLPGLDSSKLVRSRKVSRRVSKSRSRVSSNHAPFDTKGSRLHRESISPMRLVNASHGDQDKISFSEIQVEDHPDMSQCRFLQSNASPGRTDLPTTERKRREHNHFSLVPAAESDRAADVTQHALRSTNAHGKSMSPVASQECSLPTSTCRSDLDEHMEKQGHRRPKTGKFDPEMFKRLNERPLLEEPTGLLLGDSDTDAIPPFQGELAVKSMDLSEVGFSSRREDGLASTQKKPKKGPRAARNALNTLEGRSDQVRKSAVFQSKARNDRLDLDAPQTVQPLNRAAMAVGTSKIANDYYILSQEQQQQLGEQETTEEEQVTVDFSAQCQQLQLQLHFQQ